MGLRVIFMGSSDFAVPAVEALLASPHALVGCVAQPDRPRGRHLQPAPCPVKALALARGLPVLTPEKVGDAMGAIAAWQPDVALVAAYGQYIPARIANLPRLRSINIHPSLLPRYRGAAPMQWAVASGDTMTGVSIIYVAPRMDAGDILLQQEHEIAPDETAAELEARLSRAGAALAVRALDLLEAGHVHATPQDESRATWARKLEKADARLDWRQPAAALRNRVRGFQPWPGACCEAPAGSGRLLKILHTEIETGSGEPGVVLDLGPAGPLVACGEGALRLKQVQPEGRRAVSGGDYVNGARLARGARFG